MKPTHAMQRALERCPGICPGVLIRRVTAAVLNRDDSRGIKFVGRIRHEEFLGLYHFRLPDGAARYAICCCASGLVVTFLLPGQEITVCRGRFLLGNYGLEKITKSKTKEFER